MAEDSDAKMRRAEELFSHVWMVRTFLKHSPEAEEEPELSEIHRVLYDCMLALGPAISAGDSDRYLRQLKKKLHRLKSATEQWTSLQPEVSGHTNFRMSAQSLAAAVAELEGLLEESLK